MDNQTDDPQTIIRILRPYVTDARIARMEAVLASRTRYLAVLMENIYQPQNASAVLRTCDCFGVQDVHVVEEFNIYRINPMVVCGADRWVTLRRYEKSLEAINRLRADGYRIVATSLQAGSRMLPDFDIAAGPAVIVFGNERMGVSDEILAAADEHLQIPMWGFTQSLNLSVSAGIVIHELTSRLRQKNVEYFLQKHEQNELLAQWLKTTVKQPELIIKRAIEG